MRQIPMQLTPLQKEMLDNRASYIISDIIDENNKPMPDEWRLPYCINDIIFFQEELYTKNGDYFYKDTIPAKQSILSFNVENYSEMTYEQSRYKYMITGIEIVRIKDIDIFDIFGIYCPCLSEFIIYFNKLMQQQNKTVRYEDNPYIALIKIKE